MDLTLSRKAAKMKPLQGDIGNTHENCNCISCDHQKKSDRQLLRRLTAEGSKIDRLLAGKHLTLEASKLLEKLIRTRALYDELRNNLLSSSVSVSSKADLKPRQSPIIKRKALEEAENTTDISSLVDLVDKGAILGPKKISECCSCCNCHLKNRLLVQKVRKNRQSSSGGHVSSRSSVLLKLRAAEVLRSQRLFKAKNIKSDSCACARDLENLIKSQSRELLNKIRAEQPELYKQDPLITDASKYKFMTPNNEKLRKPHHKSRRSKIHPTNLKDTENVEKDGTKPIRSSAYPKNLKDVENSKNGKDKDMTIKKTKSPLTIPYAIKKSTEQLKLIRRRSKLHPTEQQDLRNKETSGHKIPLGLLDFQRKSSIELLKLIQQKIQEKLDADRKATKNHKPLEAVPDKFYSTDKRFHPDKASRRLHDHEFKKRNSRRPRINNRPLESNKSISSSTSSVTVPKKRNTKPMKTAKIRQEQLSRKPYNLIDPHIGNKIAENNNASNKTPEINETHKGKDKNLHFVTPDKKDNNKSNKSINNLPPFTKTNSLHKADSQSFPKDAYSKGSMKGKKVRNPGKLLRSVSTSSMEKSTPDKNKNVNPRQIVNKKSSLNSIGESKNKSNEELTIDKQEQLKLLEPPFRFQLRKPRVFDKPKVHEEPEKHEKPLQQKEHSQPDELPEQKIPKHIIQKFHAGTHVLTQCLCSLKIKVKKTKSKIKKNFKSSTKNQPSKCECFDNNIDKQKNLKLHPNIINSQDDTKTQPEPSKLNISLKDNMNKINQAETSPKLKTTLPPTKCELCTKITSEDNQHLPSQTSAFRKTKPTSIFDSKCEICSEIISENKQLQLDNTHTHPGRSSAIHHPSQLKSDYLEARLTSNTDIKITNKRASKSQTNLENTVKKAASSQTSNLLNKGKMGIQYHSIHADSLNGKRTSSHASKCECPVITISTKNKRFTTTQTKTPSKHTLKNVASGSQLKKSQDDVTRTPTHLIPSKNNHHADSLNGKRTSSHASKCECPVITISTKNKRFTTTQTKTPSKHTLKNVASGSQLKKSQDDVTRTPTHLIPSKNNQNVKNQFDNKTKKIRHKKSQISNSTGKSKYTITKHGLRRCLCTLKLGKLDNKKKIPKNNSKKIGASPINKDSKTQTEMMNMNQSEARQEFSTKRQDKKITKQIQKRKTRSNSSFTSRSVQLPNKKKKYSDLVTYKSDVPIQTITKNNGLSDISTREVRPSFAIKFLKKKRSAGRYVHRKLSKINKKSQVDFIHRKFDGDRATVQESSLMNNMKQDMSLLLGPTLKRCLCTLILRNKTKHKSKNSAVNTDLKTNVIVQQVHHYHENIGKCKKTETLSGLKLNKNGPFICVSGVCIHNECLEALKKRSNVRSSKNFGILTQKAKMVSKASDTRKLDGKSKATFASSDHIQAKNVVHMFRKSRKYSDFSYLPTNAGKSVTHRSYGSFHFDVSKEFPINNVIDKRLKHTKVKKKKISTDDKLLNRSSNKNISHSVDFQVHDKSGADPMPKRCFCTLKLTKKDEQYTGNKSFTPFNMKKPKQVYTMSNIIVTNSQLQLRKILSNSYYPTSFNNNKVLSKAKRWQYLNKESAPSVFSLSTISMKSKNLQSYFRESKSETLQISSTRNSLLDIASKELVHFESKIKCDVNYLNNFYSNRLQFIKKKGESDKCSINPRVLKYFDTKYTTDTHKNLYPIIDYSQLIGIQPLLRKCYCTMNIHVAGHKGTRKGTHQNKTTKLEDYECEPGICVPDECDPYKCQKLIMKRLLRKVSTQSGTARKFKTSSSSMSTSSPSRKLQSHLVHEKKKHAAKAKPVGVKYETLPRAPRSKRQAVRVGSAYSFNIKFSKDRIKTAPVAKIAKDPKRPTTRPSKPTETHKADTGTHGRANKHNRESQPKMTQKRHQGSSVSPMIKRCFCTLKLHKKGRQQKEKELRVNQGTSIPTKYKVEKPVLKTTETGQNTMNKKVHPQLLPYECEPGICVPGECDPYKCLELIKKRQGKDFGTDTMVSKVSSCSCTMDIKKLTKGKQVQAKGKQVQAKGKQVQAKAKQQKVRAKAIKSRDTAIRSKPSVMSMERPAIPTRQACKLGSSFSFSVEFYKDRISSPSVAKLPQKIHVEKVPTEKKKVQKVKKFQRTEQKQVNTEKKAKASSSQDRKKKRDTNSQVGVHQRGQSTMTSAFLKRCFCTAKLQSINVDEKTKGRKKKKEKNDFKTDNSVLSRCICTLKSIAAKKKGHPKTVPKKKEKVAPPPPKHVKTQTRKRHQHHQVLEPYECEPGVCVPGSCDPHECLKLIKKRRAKEKTTGTTGPKTVSTSSSFSSLNASKAQMTKSKKENQSKKNKKVTTKGPKVIVTEHKPVSPPLPRKQNVSALPTQGQRQAVKIGSSFSFDIKFHKDQFPNYHQVQAAATAVKSERSEQPKTRSHATKHIKNTKNKGMKGKGAALHNRESQKDAAKTKDQALGPILRRCFCTLKLQKKKQAVKQKKVKVKKEKPMHQGTSTPVTKEVPTLQNRSVMTARKRKALPNKLEPYECEPGVCVPGECDPYECEKRIKKRLMNRASGTLPDSHRTRSTTNSPHHKRRHKEAQISKTVKTKSVKPHKVKRQEPRNTVIVRPSRQAVRVGSSYSFDVEFSKDKLRSSSNSRTKRVNQYATYYYETSKRITSRSTYSSISSRNQRAQRSKAMRDSDSQVLARKMRSSTTGVSPFLKRCFCTVQLHRAEIQNNRNHGITVATKTGRHRAYENGRKLLPYECEPGVCIPGECDPYECLKRINGRMKSKQAGTTKKTQSPTTKRTQAKSHSPARTDPPHVKQRVSQESSSDGHALNIGSNMSFNIEFYKDNTSKLPPASDVSHAPRPKYFKNTETRPHRIKNMASSSRQISLRDCQSQSDCVKNECKASCAPLLKRCFCTLKLQKMGKDHHYEHKFKQTTHTMGTGTTNNIKIVPVAREIGTKTKRHGHALEPYECEPGVCVPGKCDPYECEKRIKLRNMKHSCTKTTCPVSRSMSSHISKDVGAKVNTAHNRHIEKKTTETIYRPRRPHHAENADRQSLRLGSNISFNVEFYKDNTSNRGSVPHDKIEYHKPPRKYKTKTSYASTNHKTSLNVGSHGREKINDHKDAQVGARMESKASGVMPMLKRCICTLKLQKPELRNSIKPQVTENKTVCYDKATCTKKKYTPSPPPVQTHELLPYECEPGICIPGECNPNECLERIKKRGIRRISRTTDTRQRPVSNIGSQGMPPREIPPRKVERIVEQPRFPFFCKGNTRNVVRISSNFNFNIEFLEEIVPPETTEGSKGVCKDKAICRMKNTCTSCNKDKVTTRIGHHDARDNLRSRDAQSEPVGTQDKSSAVAMLKRCFCTAKLHKNLGQGHHPQNITVGRVEEVRPHTFHGPLYSRDERCPCDNKNSETILPLAPSKLNKTESKIDETNHSTLKKILCRCKYLFAKREGRGDDLKFSKSERHNSLNTTTNNRKSSRFQSGDGKQVTGTILVNKVCTHCQARFKQSVPTSKQVHFANDTKPELQHIKPELQHIKPELQHIKPELQHTTKKLQSMSFPSYSVRKDSKKSKKKAPDVKEASPSGVAGAIDPTIVIDMAKGNIVLPEEIMKQNKQLQSKHPKSCSCCICVKKRAAAAATASAAAAASAATCSCPGSTPKAVQVKPKAADKLTEQLSIINPLNRPKPCVCGSIPCSKEIDKKAEALGMERQRRKRKICVCGSPICAAEQKKVAKLSDAGYLKVREQKRKAKRQMLESKKREMQYKKEDEELKKKRKLADKYMMKRLKKYKDQPDALLLAESALDISRLGLTSARDILRNTFRIIYDPKRTYKNFKLLVQDPGRAFRRLMDAANDSPGISTLKRIRLRCQGMSYYKSTLERLESHPVTNYIVHANDKDPKKRLNPRRRRKRREDPSFNCNPMMLSLRKRPWLVVYYTCQWFYPHCLSLLQVWRQFTDIALFILAIVVWCPCIAAMELCRAITCCFFCTG